MARTRATRRRAASPARGWDTRASAQTATGETDGAAKVRGGSGHPVPCGAPAVGRAIWGAGRAAASRRLLYEGLPEVHGGCWWIMGGGTEVLGGPWSWGWMGRCPRSRVGMEEGAAVGLDGRFGVGWEVWGGMARAPSPQNELFGGFPTTTTGVPSISPFLQTWTSAGRA